MAGAIVVLVIQLTSNEAFASVADWGEPVSADKVQAAVAAGCRAGNGPRVIAFPREALLEGGSSLRRRSGSCKAVVGV